MARRTVSNYLFTSFSSLVGIIAGRRRRAAAPGRRTLVLITLVAALVGAWPAAAGSTLPTNLRVPRDMRPLLERLLDVSPTFRQQVDLIRRTPRIRITVGYDRRRSALIDAETVIERHEYGMLIVTTTLYMPGDVTELLAHELEHVCEQIEGVRLEALAQQRPGEVHEFGGRYETNRARDAGRRAAQELRASTTGTPSSAASSTVVQ
jgi:hypothetical protein